MTRRFLELSLDQTLTDALGHRACDGQLSDRDLGFSQGLSDSVSEDLSDGLPTYVTGVVFPVDKDARTRCHCGRVLPQLFPLVGAPFELPVKGADSVLEDFGQGVSGIAPVTEVTKE